MFTESLQTDGHRLFHLLNIENLPVSIIQSLLQQASQFLENDLNTVYPDLAQKTVVNLFFENSTRTRTTFEMAATALSANVINFNVAVSATSKGESLLDTVYNLQAMGCDIFVVRHSASGASEFIAKHVGENIAVINAGDGCHAHPTQALLDLLTIQKIKKKVAGLTYAIVGDIKHSRVARSEIQALNMLGAKEVRVVAPKTILPNDIERWGAHAYYDMDRALKNVDVIIMLRMQKERMEQALIPSKEEYFFKFGLTEERLKIAKDDAIVMHPGPINRGFEIDADVVDGASSVVLEQVTHGKAMRMAVMRQLILDRQL